LQVKRAKGDVSQTKELVQWLMDWLGNPDVAAVRDKKALDHLPAAKRAAWHRLWGEVETVLALAQAKQ
jgi:hypothetical protein